MQRKTPFLLSTSTRRNPRAGLALLAALLLGMLMCGGCVRRYITIESDPPGALVYLNNQEVGRTPMTSEFTWYGNYEVILRREGYQTLKTSQMVWAPFWQWAPLDLVTEVLPLTDRHTYHFELAPHDPQADEPEELIGRAIELREQMSE